jgi:predicted nucleic-acid-binding protein
LIRSVDTNLLVRLIARDDVDQLAIAEQIFSTRVVLLSTVIQETVWVLSLGYKIPAKIIAAQLGIVMQLSNVTIIDDMACRWALTKYAGGADFADMLHLALSGTADRFATFDMDIAKFSDEQVIPVETLG